MKKIGILFIRVVETSTKRFPMKYLSYIEVFDRGDKYEVVTKDSYGLPNILYFTWMDCECWYFISSCSSLTEGGVYVR